MRRRAAQVLGPLRDRTDETVRSAARSARTRLLVRCLRVTRGPISEDYGFDRGTPVDRPWIEGFMQLHAADVRGRVLEVKDDTYSRRFGGSDVTQVDVVDIDPSNDRATLLGDLDDPGLLPDGRYDCIVLTQTLHFLDPPRALANLYAALRPGGVLLLTTGVLCRLETPDTDKWRLPPAALREVLLSALPPDAGLEVHGHGNAVAATAFVLGLSLEELALPRLLPDDWRFPVVTTARVVRPGG